LGITLSKTSQEARIRMKTLGQQFIAKKGYGYQTGFPN
jgi:hypothetical protein